MLNYLQVEFRLSLQDRGEIRVGAVYGKINLARDRGGELNPEVKFIPG